MEGLPKFALSVRQPWAWAIIHGGKDVENRSAAAVRHGMDARRIAIHAAKGMTVEEYESALDFMRSIGQTQCPRPDELVRGAVIGAASVDTIVTESDSPWFFGPRGLVLSDRAPVQPIPAVGALGYFRWEQGGALEEPKPWMRTWPCQPKATARPPELPLFTDAAE